MCDWVIMLYNRKLTEHCKPAIIKKIKRIIKNLKKYVLQEGQAKHWIISFYMRKKLNKWQLLLL